MKAKRARINGLGMAALLGIFALAAAVPASAKEEAKAIKADTRIEAVTVFLDRAQVQRVLTREMEAGRFTLSIPNLPAALQDDSVRVSGRGTAAVKIVDIKIQSQKVAETADQRLKEMEEKKREIASQVKALDDRLETLKAKVAFLERVGELKASSYGLNTPLSQRSVSEWAKIMEFLDGGLEAVSGETRRIGEQKRQLLERQAVLDHELAQNRSLTRKEKKEVVVQFDVQQPGSLNLEVSYIVPGASWHPVYDLRFAEKSSTLELVQHAMVQQETGEEWGDVRLTLSTSQALQLKQPPELDALYVDRPAPVRASSIPGTGNGSLQGTVTDTEGNPLPGVTLTLKAANGSRLEKISDERGKYSFQWMPTEEYELMAELEGFQAMRRKLWLSSNRASDASFSMQIGKIEEVVTVAGRVPAIDVKDSASSYALPGQRWTTPPSSGGSSSSKAQWQERRVEHETAQADVVEKNLVVSYALAQRETIPSTDQPQKVTVSISTLPCQKEYLAVPRVAEATYLKAKVVNGPETPLLAGKANVFYDENFISTSEIPQVSGGEDFDLFIGEESGIRVKREVKTKKEGAGFLSHKQKTVYEVAIKLENFHSQEEKVTIQDLLPMSEAKSIDVELVSITPETKASEEAAKDRKEKGILSWELKLAPREKKEVRFVYSITASSSSDFYSPEK